MHFTVVSGNNLYVDLSKVSSIIIKSLFVFLAQKIAQFGQDVFIAKPSLEISEVMRGNLFRKIQKIEMNSVEKISAGDITYRLTEDADRVSEVIYKTAQDTIPCTLQSVSYTHLTLPTTPYV